MSQSRERSSVRTAEYLSVLNPLMLSASVLYHCYPAFLLCACLLHERLIKVANMYNSEIETRTHSLSRRGSLTDTQGDFDQRFGYVLSPYALYEHAEPEPGTGCSQKATVKEGRTNLYIHGVFSILCMALVRSSPKQK